MLPWMLDLFQRPVPASAALNCERDPSLERTAFPCSGAGAPFQKLQTQWSTRCRRRFQGASTSGSGVGVVCEQPVKCLRTPLT